MKAGQFRLTLIVVVLGLLAIYGCSSGGGNIGIPPVTEARDVPLSQGTHVNWGIWQFIANPDAGTLDIVKLRDGNMHLNALVFLEPPPFANLSLESLEFNGNIIETDIGLRHPFLGLDEFSGFDVCGIFITNGSVTAFSDPDLRMAGPGDTRLLNPDGLTRWWNPAEFPVNNKTMFSYNDGLLGTADAVGHYNSTLNAYKYFCDDLTDPDSPLDNVTQEKRGLFSAGMKNIRHYTIELGAGLVFNYAVDANWQFPTGSAPWEVPDDFAPEANRVEPWRITVTETGNNLWNEGGDSGGSLNLSIDVYDWYNSGLNTVKVESLTLTPTIFEPDPVSGGEGYSTYEVDFTSVNPPPDSVGVLITVETEAQGYQNLLPGKTVSAYYLHTAVVGANPGLIVGDLSLVYECPGDPCAGDDFQVEVSEAYDPGGQPVTITWDFDGDFDFADDMDGDDTNLSGTYSYAEPGEYEAWCRVSNGTTYVDGGPLPINVIECIPESPVMIKEAFLTDSGTGYNLAYSDGFVYMTYSDGGGSGSPNGLYIFDVDPIDETHQVGYVETSHMPQAVAYKDGYCYIAGVYLLGIITIDVDPPETAHIVDVDNPDLANGFVNEAVVYGDYLYFAAQWNALMIYDISNPANPVFKGKTGPTPNNEYCAAVDVSPEKGYAFITWGYEVNPEMADYLHVVDISDPTHPLTVLSLDLPHNASNLVVDGDYVYVLENSIMHVFNIENPLAAYEETSIPVASGLQDIWITGNYAYLVNYLTSPWSGNLIVADVSDPTAPVVMTSIPLTSIAFGITEHCGIAYAVTGTHWEGSNLIPGALDIVELY